MLELLKFYLLKKKYTIPVLALSCGLVLFIIGFSIYFNALYTRFQLDDERMILQEIPNVSTLTPAEFLATWRNRSVTAVTFALNYELFGVDTVSFHIVNVLIHCISAVFVFRLSYLVLGLAAKTDTTLEKQKFWLSFFAALLFLVHPLQTSAVTYISQRLASLVTLFYLASCIFFIEFRLSVAARASLPRLVLYGCCFFCSMVLAFLSKETSFTIPVLIIFIELLFFSTFPTTWSSLYGAIKKNRYQIMLYLSMVLFMIQYNWSRMLYYLNIEHHNLYGETIRSAEYWYTQQFVLLKYLQLVFFPVRQSLEHYIPVSYSFFDTRTLLSFLGLCLLLILAAVSFRKQKVVSFVIGWFFITVAVESSFLPLPDVSFEHRMYLPLAGVSLGVIWLLYTILQRKIFRTAIIIAVLCYWFSYLTIERNRAWFSPLTIWYDVLEKNPKSVRAHQNLAVYYTRNGANWLAEEELQAAIALYPTILYSRVKLVEHYILSDRYPEAVEQARIAVSLDPGSEQAQQLYEEVQAQAVAAQNK